MKRAGSALSSSGKRANAEPGSPITNRPANSSRGPIASTQITASRWTRNLPPGAFREVGFGVLDFKRILAAAPEAGVQHYFVEQDEVAEDPVESLRASYRTLEALKF